MPRNCMQINASLEQLGARYHCPISVRIVDDPDAPKAQTRTDNGVHVITLNLAKIPMTDYEAYAGYHVRKVLLPQLVLETERLILRRFRHEDAADCFAFLSDKDGAYMDCCKPFTAMDEAYFEVMDAYAQHKTRYMLVMKETERVIGTVNILEDQSRAVETMEIGYCISPAYQRKGYAFEALSALLYLLQEELMLDMVIAGVLESNHKSSCLLRKLGFRQEGIRHKAIWHDILNQPVDLLYYYRDRTME